MAILKQFVLLALLVVSVKAQEAVLKNSIDALSSASSCLRVDSGTVYRTQAELYWWERYTNEDIRAYKVMWGKQQGVFSDTLNLYTMLRVNDTIPRETKKILLQPLTDSTTYFGRFYRDYKGRVFITDFVFNTPPLPSKAFNHRKGPQFTVSETVTVIDVYTVDGRCCFSTSVELAADLSGILRARHITGLAVINFRGNSGFIRSEKVIVGK